MMDTSQPSTSSSLLWTHQLKRENAFLLSRIEEVESKISTITAQVKTLDSSATNDLNSITNLSQRLDKYQTHQDQLTRGLALLQSIMEESNQALQARTDAISTQLVRVEQNAERTAEAVSAAAVAADTATATASSAERNSEELHRRLLARVHDVSSNLDNYEAKLNDLGRKVDVSKLQRIRQELANLGTRIETQREGAEKLTESVMALEMSNRMILRENERLGKKIERQRNTPRGGRGGNESDRQMISAPVFEIEDEGNGQIAPENRAAEAHAEAEGPRGREGRWGSDVTVIGSSTNRSPNPIDQENASGGVNRVERGVVGLKARIANHERSHETNDSELIAQQPIPFNLQRFVKKTRAAESLKRARDMSKNKQTNDTDVIKKRKPHRWGGGGADKEIVQSGLRQIAKRNLRNQPDATRSYSGKEVRASDSTQPTGRTINQLESPQFQEGNRGTTSHFDGDGETPETDKDGHIDQPALPSQPAAADESKAVSAFPSEGGAPNPFVTQARLAGSEDSLSEAPNKAEEVRDMPVTASSLRARTVESDAEPDDEESNLEGEPQAKKIKISQPEERTYKGNKIVKEAKRWFITEEQSSLSSESAIAVEFDDTPGPRTRAKFHRDSASMRTSDASPSEIIRGKTRAKRAKKTMSPMQNENPPNSALSAIKAIRRSNDSIDAAQEEETASPVSATGADKQDATVATIPRRNSRSSLTSDGAATTETPDGAPRPTENSSVDPNSTRVDPNALQVRQLSIHSESDSEDIPLNAGSRSAAHSSQGVQPLQIHSQPLRRQIPQFDEQFDGEVEFH